MGFRLPGAKLSARDVPDPTLFRAQVQPAVEEIGGKLNEHNVKAGTFSASRAPEAYLYDFHYAQVASDPHIHTTLDHLPDGTDANAFRVSDAGEWDKIDGVTLSYSEGQHTLWLIGWLQYYTTTEFSLSSNPQSKPRLQFALRINGAVVQATITGTSRADEGAPRGVRPTQPVTGNTANTMASLDYETSRATGSMSWHCKFLRMQCQLMVPQGTTTAEIVARRIISDVPTMYASAPLPVFVGNRIICGITMKMGGNDSSSAEDVGATYPADGDTLNAANTAGTMLTPLVTTLNTLSMDALQRAGLRNEHLPQKQVTSIGANECLAPSGTVKDYPGWGNTGVVGATPNWDYVNDGAGHNLEISLNDGSGNWDFTANPAFMVVFSNIAFSKAAGGWVEASANKNPCFYGVFGLGSLYAGGGTSLNQVNQGWVNDPNARPDYITAFTFVSDYCYTDVPMFAVFDYRKAAPAGGAVDQIRQLVSCDNTSAVSYERSSMFAILFRP